MEFFIDNIHTIIFFPLWVFLLVVLGRFFGVIQSRRVVTTLTLASTLYGLIFAVGTFLTTYKVANFSYDNSYPFLKIEDYVLNFGVYIDNLSVMMLLVVTSISFVVQLYSSSYMKDDKSYARFFGYLNLFNFSMIGLVLSVNLFQTYVFWELVGVSSYLLIGFWYKRPSASKAAKKAFIMNRIGDVGLLSGVIVTSYFMYQYSSVTSLADIPFANINDIASFLYSYTTDFSFVVICIMLLFGSIAKSAQFPLHTWLADAMEGPTPVSALIHSATMVAAGVYLIARLYPIYSQSDIVMNLIAIIGLVTALICGYFAITQNDLKRILAYSTNSQLGLMFLALGCGSYAGGLFHLVTHAYFKSMLFLCSGIVIHNLFNLQDIRFMGGLRKYMPLTAICYLIGCFSISGLLFSGFFSKEMILTSLLENNHHLFAIGFLLVSLMTAFYMFRSYFVVFEGECRSEKIPHKPDFIMNLSISILAVITIILGFLINNNFINFIQGAPNIAQSHTNYPLFVALSVAIIGFAFAWIFYNTKVKAFKIPVLYQLSYNRFYIDNLYNFLAERVYWAFSRICAIVDKYVVDGVVILSGLGVRSCSWVFAKMQTGNFQSYLAYALVFMAIIFTGLMLAYTMIIHYGLISSY